MADDHAPPQADADAFDLETAEGLEAYLLDLDTRVPVPERLRYPETDEEYGRMIKEAEQEFEAGNVFTLEEVRARFAERIASAKSFGRR